MNDGFPLLRPVPTVVPAATLFGDQLLLGVETLRTLTVGDLLDWAAVVQAEQVPRHARLRCLLLGESGWQPIRGVCAFYTEAERQAARHEAAQDRLEGQ